MYQTLTFYHNFFRWLVLAFLLLAIFRALKGVLLKSSFSKVDNSIRHWTATVAHVQLVIGMILYFKSPLIQYFLSNFKASLNYFDALFFGLIHSVLMFISVVFITVGSSLAKRKTDNYEKHKTMLIWFTIALIIIFIAIPWPFSPLATRPYYR